MKNYNNLSKCKFKSNEIVRNKHINVYCSDNYEIILKY